jgi:hypothetical protein
MRDVHGQRCGRGAVFANAGPRRGGRRGLFLHPGLGIGGTVKGGVVSTSAGFG